jgi:hypothetical protein
MGDRFSNITNSTIVNRSLVEGAVTSLQQSNQAAGAEASRSLRNSFSSRATQRPPSTSTPSRRSCNALNLARAFCDPCGRACWLRSRR